MHIERYTPSNHISFRNIYIFLDLLIYLAEKNEFRDTAHSFYQFTFKAEEILSRVLPATPILPKNNIEMNLANVAAKEIARQLTLIGMREGGEE